MTATLALHMEDLIPTRYSLLSRLENWDDQKSWKDFFDTYWRLIHSVAIKSGLTEAEAQDVVQETVISVAKYIHKFKRDRAMGSFKGWLRNIIRWRIADQLEKRNPTAPKMKPLPAKMDEEADVAEFPDSTIDPHEALWEAEWQANLFEVAVQRVKQQVKEEYYLIFDFYVLKGWPVKKVARRFGVSSAQVYLAKHRVSSLIRTALQTLEKEPL